jgi:RHS repeat-associated protein
MAGISSKAAGKLENRYKYNEGTERTTDLDLNWDETDFRSYDAQIGRFLQIDPLADYFEHSSPYVYAENNPVLMNDPYGLNPVIPSDPNTLPDVVVTSVRHKKVTGTPSAPTSLPVGGTGITMAPSAMAPAASQASTARPASEPSTPAPPAAAPQLPPVRFNFGPDANRGAVSQHSMNLLQDIMRASGNTSLTITSTQRSPEAQARAMYNNIQSLGVQHNLNL